MKIGANYSNILINLLKTMDHNFVDYIKVPTALYPKCVNQFNVAIKPLLLHFACPGILEVLHPDQEKRINIEQLKYILNLTQSSVVSTHLTAHLKYFPDLKREQHSKNNILANKIRDRFLNTYKLFKDNFNIPMLIETFPYYSFAKQFLIASDPEFINDLCNCADCYLLIDISHVRVSAHYMNMDVFDYLDKLPLNRTKELHISGTSKLFTNKLLYDSHSNIDELDIKIIDYILNMSCPEYMTIEYGSEMPHLRWSKKHNDPKVLVSMIETIRNFVRRF